MSPTAHPFRVHVSQNEDAAPTLTQVLHEYIALILTVLPVLQRQCQRVRLF
jgi:hypothetical protein